MTASLVEKIADAVLYEGYILYPYRPSAVKNQQRWNFGALCPETYSVAQRGTENWTMQTECLVEGDEATTVDLKVRFLHLLSREVGQGVDDCQLPASACGHYQLEPSISPSHFAGVGSLEVNGRLFQTWQEAVEREVVVSAVPLTNAGESAKQRFSFPQSQTFEPLSDDVSGKVVGVIVRRQQAIEGVVEVRIDDVSGKGGIKSPLKINVRILNRTRFENAESRSRDEALMRSFVSTHTILNVDKGEFVSLLDPPDSFQMAAAECRNIGTYPVLVGADGARDCMLSSPIILYDYPQIAPESAGNLYDGTEIDEILTLRIMTLTEEEKREMRGADDRARQILERTETLPMEQLMKMHGAMKGVKS
jgi:hypothetical protein